ncbi:MAG: glycosyltransferase [Pseudotabrizicola sp.]|uniref:glycosyltransferase n=1 Tax=Pseudotabrizicola sp. TaxID=2939647 RepID=UPI002727C783|nr:glycosyltransferase [Pseudotabrizicola sp.]MDO9640866.1 glycosyltransferase [Pseudotabrizicola sp.]
MFSYVIMTRFNLATPGKEAAIRTQAGWLEGRFHLFETYCLPSIAAQRNTAFDWIIYFDIDTPDIFKRHITALQKVFPFHAYYTPLFRSEGWNRSLRETYPLQEKLLLTTRLDNDDALPVDFTDRLQAAVRANQFRPGAYNFRNGLIRQGDALYAIDHPKNAFFSRLEPVEGALCPAPAIQHMQLDTYGPIHQIDGAPGWLQIVHETNVSNKVRGNRVAPDPYLHLFPPQVMEGLSHPSSFEIMAQNFIQTPLWSLRDRMVEIWRMRGSRRKQG